MSEFVCPKCKGELYCTLADGALVCVSSGGTCKWIGWWHQVNRAKSQSAGAAERASQASEPGEQIEQPSQQEPTVWYVTATSEYGRASPEEVFDDRGDAEEEICRDDATSTIIPVVPQQALIDAQAQAATLNASLTATQARESALRLELAEVQKQLDAATERAEDAENEATKLAGRITDANAAKEQAEARILATENGLEWCFAQGGRSLEEMVTLIPGMLTDMNSECERLRQIADTAEAEAAILREVVERVASVLTECTVDSTPDYDALARLRDEMLEALKSTAGAALAERVKRLERALECVRDYGTCRYGEFWNKYHPPADMQHGTYVLKVVDEALANRQAAVDSSPQAGERR